MESFRLWMEGVAEELLAPYINRLVHKKLGVSDFKEINDAIWNTIVLYPFEIIFLDCPLLQRLRQIAQLGVVHWTFPCAVHTRFEHSVGSVKKLQEMLESLDQHRPEEGPIQFPKVPAKLANSLRVAALCHDIGHGFMSHVSENALRTEGKLENLYLEFETFFKKDQVSLSEAAAFFLVGSPAFARLVAEARRIAPKHEVVEDLPSFIKSAIVGQAVSDDYPLINELISGPFDCDKLDYMRRDATMTGIPSVTDVPRLAHKIRIVRLTEAAVPQEVLRNVKKKKDNYYLQGIALSGATTIDELMIGRALLFDKVYRHQKVRTAECMVRNIIACILDVTGADPLTLPFSLADSDFLDFERSVLEKKLGMEIADDQWKSLEPAREIARRLRSRRFFSRAYSFAGRMPQDPYQSDVEQRGATDQLLRELEQPEFLRDYKNRIVRELIRMNQFLGGELFSYGAEELTYLVAIDGPSAPTQASEMSRAFLITHEKRILRFSEGSAQSSGWTNAYPLTRELGFVFASEDIADPLFLAAEKVFRTDLGLRTPQTALYYAKVDTDAVNALRKRLDGVGFYDASPNDLRPRLDIFERGDFDQRIVKVCERVAAFEGVSSTGADKGRPVRISSERLTHFLSQFRTESEVEALLQMLERIKLVNREATIAGLRHFLANNQDFGEAFVCPFGGPRDSSSILTYFAEDLRSEFGLKAASIADALSRGDKPILFLDDIIGSGRQALTILNQWLGLEHERRLEEDHVEPLQPAQVDQFKKTRFGFAYACGSQEGLGLLLEECRTLNINAVGSIHDSTLPSAFAEGFLDMGKDDIDKVKESFTNIGADLLRSQHQNDWDNDKIEGRALGYGNHAYLVAFPYNVPTQTLTLLWSGGSANGSDWLPLMPRRRKA